MSNYSNVVLVFSEVREHPRLSRARVVTRAHYGSLGEGAPETLVPYKLGMPLFFFHRGEGAPETLMRASDHSSTLLSYR